MQKEECNPRHALVCGGSEGIGYGIATELVRSGIHVTLLARREEVLCSACDELSSLSGGFADYIVGDITEPGEGERATAIMLQRHGGVDVLVNNAGGPPMGSFLEHSDLTWTLAYKLCLQSTIDFTRAVVPLMKERKFGRIINVTSLLAKEPAPIMVLSATFRAGVSAFSKAISSELIRDGITINTLLPSAVWTARAESLTRQTAEREGISFEEAKVRAIKNLPPGRYAEATELGALVSFLISPAAGYITGQSIAVDGGLGKSVF